MKILVVTDAWHPQVNGVVRTLGHVALEATALGAELEFVTPNAFVTVPVLSYPEIRLSLAFPCMLERRLDAIQPNAIHIATEGPLGQAMRRVCLRRGQPFTTSFHTRFPDYVAERVPFGSRWSSDLTWAWLRRFHAPASAVLGATPSLVHELTSRGFRNVKLWTRGVDTELFRPRADAKLDFPRPIFLTVGRIAIEKNLEAFLSLDLPGSKLVAGDGPARRQLEQRYPQAMFLGAKQGEALAKLYAASDVFVFPSLTDTFGLVLLEALASGLPVAAFPTPAPRDVLGNAPVGVTDPDLRRACLAALHCSRETCRAFALPMSWSECTRIFLKHVAEGNTPVRRKRAKRLRRIAA